MKLTVPQLLTLIDLSECKHAAAYQLAVRVSVLRRLAKRGLAEHMGGSGPHSVWRITEAGRAHLIEGTAE